MSVDAATVRANADRILERIAAAGGDPDAVTVVAVTKGFGPDAVRAALDAGLVDVGENYAQELLAKAGALDAAGTDRPRWHFIGRLQSNKVRQIADRVALWQSVDRASLVGEIARRAPGAAVLLQVNATGEAHKGGAAPGAVADLHARALDAGLEVRGLMGVGHFTDPDATDTAFATITGLADDLALPVRSVGMSGDLEAAVRAGSTMVRIGTALFGPRP